MNRILAIGFTFAIAATNQVVADGYLQHGAPLPLRFGPPPPVRPPVNESVLALTADAKKELPATAPGEPPAFTSEELNAAIAALINRVNNFRHSLTNDPAALATTEEVVDSQLTPPATPAGTSPASQEGEAAALLPGILTIFNTGDDGRNRRAGAAVVVPTTIFTPPQPTSSSRAVYRSQ